MLRRSVSSIHVLSCDEKIISVPTFGSLWPLVLLAPKISLTEESHSVSDTMRAVNKAAKKTPKSTSKFPDST